MALDDNGGGGAGGEGGFGGSADLLGGGAQQPQGGADGDAGGEGGGQEGGEGEQQPIGGGADPDWYSQLSGDAEGESAAHRDFAKTKGWKTLDDVVKSYREAERAVRDSGRIKVPGEGASAEEVATFNKAIGVPDDVKGYALPDLKDADGNSVPLDQSLLGHLLPKALERGVPAAAMNGLIADYVQLQLDEVAQMDADQQKLAGEWLRKQGDQGNARMSAVDGAARALGLKSADIISIGNAIGRDRALEMFAKLGEGMAEDVLITGGKGRFGVTGREAQAELDKMKQSASSDAKLAAAINTPGTAENARWNRHLAEAAKWQEQQERMNA